MTHAERSLPNGALFLALVRREVLSNLLNLRFVVVFFLAIFLLVGSATVMIAQFVTDKTAYDISTSINERRLRTGRRVDPGNYQWDDKTVERPVSITRILAQGGEKDGDPRARGAPEFSPYFQGEFKRNPITNLFPSFDIVFVVGVVFSLLVFLLSYDCVSGEREEGTLRVLLSCAVPRDLVLAAKWAGGLLSVSIPVVAAFLLIALMLTLNRGIVIDADTWLRIAAIGVLCLLYIGVVFSAAMALSVAVRSSATAVLVLLLFWVVVVVAVPSLSTPVAYLALSPSGPHTAEVNMGRVGIMNWSAWNRLSEEMWVAMFGRVEWDALTEEQRLQWRKQMERREVIEAQHVGEIVDSVVFFGQQASRDYEQVGSAARWLARLSPYGCLQNAATALAGTGMRHELALRQAMERLDRAAIDYVVEFHKSGAQVHNFDVYQTPSFRPPRTLFSDALAESAVDIALLLLVGLGFMMFAYLAFLRSDVA